MTGIERLRELAHDYVEHSWSEAGKARGRLLFDIADQIERERTCDSDAIENVRLIVGGVVTDMERHILGHEGMDDSPVARWARELREALGGEKHDHAKDVSMSAYDLLPADEREAITWVREHGGVERVKGLLDWVVGHCSTRQQLDFDFWLSGRVMHELGFEEDVADRDEVERRLLARLMPEGMEWMVEAWPRFEDDAPVRFLDDFERYGDENGVSAVTMYSDGSFALNCRAYSKGEHVNRPAPKVLDADGVEIRVGDTVWTDYGDGPWTVTKITTAHAWHVYGESDELGSLDMPPSTLTHRAPVLAADGRPLREGETVYHVADGRACVVREVREDGAVVEPVDGRPRGRCRADYLAHELPDSYDALWEDIENCAVGYEGFMRRVKALAGGA